MFAASGKLYGSPKTAAEALASGRFFASRIVERDPCARHVGVGFHNREPQTRAEFAGARNAVEGVENARAFFGRNPRAAVEHDDFEERFPGIDVSMRFEFHEAAFGCIAHGVFQKVADDGAHGRSREAVNVIGRFEPLGFKAHGLLVEGGQKRFDQFARELREVPGFGVAQQCRFRLARLRARKEQELRNLMHRALEPRLEVLDDAARSRRQLEFAQVFGLNRERREGTAQLVRGVCRKAQFARSRGVNAREEAVDGFHKGARFRRHAFERQWRQVVGAAATHGFGSAGERAHARPQNTREDEGEHGQKHE